METQTTRSHPPGPQFNPIRQILFFRSFEKNFLTSTLQWFRRYGDVVYMDAMGRQLYFLRHPNHIHEVVLGQAAKLHKSVDYKDPEVGLASFLGNGLLTSDGDYWRRQRKLVQPAFHTQRIQAYAGTMVDYALRMLANWQDGRIVDIDTAMAELTMKIVAKSLFDADVSADVTRVANAIDVLQTLATEPSLLPSWIPTPRQRRKRQALADLDEIVYGFIRDWRAKEEDKGDLLSMLMLATDEEDGTGMSDKQTRDELVTLLLAGHETTANAMNWTFYLLDQHPDVEAKLHQELDAVLGGRPPQLDDLAALAYTEMVVKESMRLYPPAWSFGRQAIEPVEIGGYTVPIGAELHVISYATHRDERWFEQPERFWPQRFSQENEPNIPKYAYIPFGGGARICIGNAFAMMEARLLLATIAQRYRLRLAPNQTVTPLPQITLGLANGMHMRLEERQPIRVPA